MSPHDYRRKLRRILGEAPPDLFPGQKEEIRRMTYAQGCDICEHVPVLIEYGQQVDTITEMGVRFGWSTRSFLFARPKKLLSIDKYPWDSVHQSGSVREPGNSQFKKYKAYYDGVVDYSYLLGDTTKIDPIEECDLLFIDTFHHRDCLRIELEKHGNRARKFLIFHDTETFGHHGQIDDSLTFFDQPTTGEEGTGLLVAIREFMKANFHWACHEHFSNNNGLTVLART